MWSRYHGVNVLQGSWQSNGPWTGAWFYGGQAGQLAGRTVTNVTLQLGAILRSGAYGSTRTLHLWRHSSPSRGGQPVLTGGPVDVTIPAGSQGKKLTITSDQVPGLIGLVQGMGESDGLAITGDPYLGITGTSDPTSGLLTIDWKA